MTKESKILSIRLIISLTIFLIALIIPQNTIKVILFIVSYLIIGYDIIKEAIENIFKGKVFDENFLMFIATVGAFIVNEYPEAVMVMWLFQVGEWFQDHATQKSRKSITDLMNIRPDFANIEKDGSIIEVDPKEVKINDLIIIKSGEKIPLDGIVIDGTGLVDTSALTGESVPKNVTVGSQVYSGTINTNGMLKVKVTKKFEESAVSKILELVENSTENKSETENFITKFSKVYTPIVVILAICLAVIPPLVIPRS